MANGNSKVVACAATLLFNDGEYRLRSVPADIAETCDLPNITTLSDDWQQFEESACTEDGDFTFVVLGDDHPLLDEIGSLGLALIERTADGEQTTRTVSMGRGFVTNCEPSTITADGDRVKTWTVTIKPTGDRT